MLENIKYRNSSLSLAIEQSIKYYDINLSSRMRYFVYD